MRIRAITTTASTPPAPPRIIGFVASSKITCRLIGRSPSQFNRSGRSELEVIASGDWDGAYYDLAWLADAAAEAHATAGS